MVFAVVLIGKVEVMAEGGTFGVSARFKRSVTVSAATDGR